jgi:hypothetical protein
MTVRGITLLMLASLRVRGSTDPMQDPKKAASFLLVLIALAMCFADYWEYSKAFHMDPMTRMDVIAESAPAPEQYRVGVILPAWFVARHTHLALRHVFTAIDTAAGFLQPFCYFFYFEDRGPTRVRASRLDGSAPLPSFCWCSSIFRGSHGTNARRP